MLDDSKLALELERKNARKARPGGMPKLGNLPRNWAHQALRYMDTGEFWVRVLVEALEFLVVWLILGAVLQGLSWATSGVCAFLIAHTWNWVTNGLFWTVVVATFPGFRNAGAAVTVEYLNQMRERLLTSGCISGVAVYGSVARGMWHDRSDIDIRFLRRPGLRALLCAAWITMGERFRAFRAKQSMDLYLADDVDFLKKMRSDELPVILLCRDKRLSTLYPDRKERRISLRDLVSVEADA